MSSKSNSCIVILPIHLFDISILEQTLKTIQDEITTIYITEEPVYFGNRDIKLNFNKLKLIYHRSSLQYYNN